MSPDIVLTPAHWVYLLGVLVIICTMACKANVVAPAIVATAATAFAVTGQASAALESVFFGPLTAARELFNIFLVISLMTAFMNALRLLQTDVRIVRPFRRVMTNGHVGFFVLGGVSYLLSLFFWPTPSVPLIAGILLPAAIYAGVPPMGAALCIAIAGLGTALSSDYVIKVGPGITAKAAGLPVNDVADKALILSLIVGGVAFTLAYLRTRGTILTPSVENLQRWEASEVSVTASGDGAAIRAWRRLLAASQKLAPQRNLAASTLAFAAGSVNENTGLQQPPEVPRSTPGSLPSGHGASAAQRSSSDNGTSSSTLSGHGGSGVPRPTQITHVPLTDMQTLWSKVFAVATPLAFLAIVAFMVMPKLVPGMKGVTGAHAAALVGGVAALLMVLATAAYDVHSICKGTAERVTEGFVFSFRAMSSVLPIAGFFFIGVASTAGPILGLPESAHGPALLTDLVRAGDQWIPHDRFFVGFGMLLTGMVTGIDGSGFAGLPLVGGLANALGRTVDTDVSALAAIGQMGSVWTGKTLTAWSALAAVAGFARVSVLDAVRNLALPVILGLVAATAFAVIVW